MTVGIIKTSDGSLNVGAYKGMTGRISVDDLEIDVEVDDARLAYGRLDLRVTPKSGHGSKWVSAHRLTLTSEGTSSVTAKVLPLTTKENGKVLSFRQEVARRKAELALHNIKSHLGQINKKEEIQ